jgi:uncharacterized protein involved in exopolysaccharide biosynthesis/Mrp family chromosome partitioning ATPase
MNGIPNTPNLSTADNRHAAGVGEAAWALPGSRQGTTSEATQLPAELTRILADDVEDAPALPARLAPARLLRSLWIKRWPITTTFFASVLLALIIALTVIDDRWEAVTTLITYKDNEALSIGDGRPYRAPEFGIATLVDTLKLPSSLAEARRRIGIDVDLTTMAQAIDVSIAEDSNVLNLKVLWDDPVHAAALANQMADIFIDTTQRIRVEQTQRDHERYSKQLEEVRQRVAEADLLVLYYQQTHGVSDFTEETKARLYDMSRLQAEYRTQLSEVEALKLAKAEFAAAIEEQPESLITSKLYRNPINRRLEEIGLELMSLRGHYKDGNPKIDNLEREAATLRAMPIQDMADQVPESTQSLNELRQDLKLELQKLNDQLRVAEGRALGLDASVKEITDQLSYLSAREKEYFPLKANQETARQLEASLAAKSEEARIASATSKPAFMVLGPAQIPYLPAPSGRKLLVAAFAVLGLGAGLFVALLLELFDPRVLDRRDANELAEDAVSAAFSTVATPRINLSNAGQADAQAWRRFVNDMQADEEIESIAIVSAKRKEGRSSVAWNIAASMALKGHSTILVDADLRTIAGERSCTPSRPGLTDLLVDEATLPECLTNSEITGMRSLAAAAPFPANETAPWLGSAAARQIVTTLDRLPDRIIYDLPPLNDDETAIEFAASIGAVVFVSRSGQTARREAVEILDRLCAHGVRIIGSVVVDMPEERSEHYRPWSNLLAMLKKPFSRSASVRGGQYA